MCGLVGIAGKIGANEEKAFKTMLFLDTLRGKHSTGVASLHGYNQKPEFSVVKDSVSGPEFIEKKEFTQLLAKKSYILLGHNRFATQGAIVPENAHPFEFDNVIGAHNGSLAFGWKTAFHDSTHRVVDSEAVYSEMNHSDGATTWGKLNGAATLTWIDKRDNTLHFLRNKERPLFYTTANKGETLLWASEPWMIHVAAGREQVELDENPREVAINTQYTFDIKMVAGHKISVTREAVAAYVPPKWEPKKAYDYYGAGSDDWQGKKWLDKEGIKEGEEVEFTVDKIHDYMESGMQRARITGTTLLGTPVTLYHVDSIQYDALLSEMWEFEGCVFRGVAKYGQHNGLILTVASVVNTYYTLADLAEAQAKLEAEQLDKEIKLLAASLGEGDGKIH